MKNEHCDFPWPTMPRGVCAPRWMGDGFQVGMEKLPILSYDPENSNWSEALTDLHEKDAGANHPIDKASRRLAMDSVQQFCSKENSIILDVGCSSGFLAMDIRSRFPKAFVIGSDYIAAPLQRLASEIGNMPLLQFDLRKCPLPDECVDVVTSLNVLEHIDQDALAVREIARILKPGGIAHFEVPCNQGLYDIYDEILMHHRRYSISQLKMLVQQAGLKVMKASHLGFFLYPMFSVVKRRNKRHMNLDKDSKLRLVQQEIGRSRKSVILGLLIKAELCLGQFVNYPIGIRCVVACRKM